MINLFHSIGYGLITSVSTSIVIPIILLLILGADNFGKAKDSIIIVSKQLSLAIGFIVFLLTL
jgi:hypothetical protein